MERAPAKGPRRVVVALALVAGLLGLGTTAVHAVQPRNARPVWSHTVVPGETLWSLAPSASPHRDRRETVDRLIAANHLRSPIIRPGQRLVLPRS